jgi:phosphate transport system permease protein
MTDVAAPAVAGPSRADAKAALIARRYRAERRFRAYGIASIIVTAIFLVLVMADIVSKGYPAFTEHRLDMQITADPAIPGSFSLATTTV